MGTRGGKPPHRVDRSVLHNPALLTNHPPLGLGRLPACCPDACVFSSRCARVKRKQREYPTHSRINKRGQRTGAILICSRFGARLRSHRHRTLAAVARLFGRKLRDASERVTCAHQTFHKPEGGALIGCRWELEPKCKRQRSLVTPFLSPKAVFCWMST